jgi:hypothetical protein
MIITPRPFFMPLFTNVPEGKFSELRLVYVLMRVSGQ